MLIHSIINVLIQEQICLICNLQKKKMIIITHVPRILSQNSQLQKDMIAVWHHKTNSSPGQTNGSCAASKSSCYDGAKAYAEKCVTNVLEKEQFNSKLTSVHQYLTCVYALIHLKTFMRVHFKTCIPGKTSPYVQLCTTYQEKEDEHVPQLLFHHLFFWCNAYLIIFNTNL